MASAGKKALTVADQLGHSSIATTNKYYHGDATARANATASLSI
jgi:integrase